MPRRFPGIKLVWSEGGIGWVPAAMERADRQYERHLWSHVRRPHAVGGGRRNMWFCMIEEPVGIKYRHDFEVDHILWESDYPHADTPFPNTQASAKEVFEGMPAGRDGHDHARNAEALFHHPLVVRELADAGVG